MEKINYNGWPNCCRLSNSLVDLVITTDVGPRIIRYGFINEENELNEVASHQGITGGTEWRMYGGHRFWHAPEADPRTYYPDNEPVQCQEFEDFVRITQPVETTTGLQKELDIRLYPADTHVRVIHRLRNTSLWDIQLAPWALTVVATGGTAIIPMPPRGSHLDNLLPVNSLAMWAYTDMSDPRWSWGRQYILLRQDPLMKTPQKIGALVPAGWLAYARRGHLFIKKYDFNHEAAYPDFGCSVESFTNDWMLELETLGPLTTLKPGQTVEHVEDWYLFREVPTPHNDAQVERHILPKILETGV